jgi:predicted Rossmann fold flavoprotein
MAEYDVVVIGAGAAGMMCAATAGQRGRRVLLVDHFHVLGEKIRISGGGRCNFTNVDAGPANYLSQDPAFCATALARFTPADFVRMVERHGIPYHEKKLGQLFCDDSSHDIIRMLKAECMRGRVDWRMPCAVSGVTKEDGRFRIATATGDVRASTLVVATGGLTVPKIGATPFGYRLAEQFAMAVVPPRPALVPLAFAPDALARYGDLSGLSLEAEVTCGAGRFRESLLFTHRGLSGPVILQASSYWDGRTPLAIDLLPGLDVAAWLGSRAGGRALLPTVLAERLPKRFAQQWSDAEGAAKPMRELGADRLREIAARLHAWRVLPSGTLGYNKAEVTAGGVDTRGLDPATLESRTVRGLHFIGEVVDVTGWLGGYNFQWAWASGYVAGQAA